MDPIYSNQEKVATSTFRRSRADNYIVSGWIWLKFKLIQALMYDIGALILLPASMKGIH